MHKALTTHPLANAGGVEEIDAALFKDSRSHTVLDVLSRARLDHYGFDAFAAQQMREHEPCRTGTDDRDARSHAGRPRTGTDGGRAVR
jgi:hypothetical protein